MCVRVSVCICFMCDCVYVRVLWCVLVVSMEVTAEMLRPFLEGWTLKQILDAKRLFIVDMKILDKIPTKNNRPVNHHLPCHWVVYHIAGMSTMSMGGLPCHWEVYYVAEGSFRSLGGLPCQFVLRAVKWRSAWGTVIRGHRFMTSKSLGVWASVHLAAKLCPCVLIAMIVDPKSVTLYQK